MSGTPPPPSLKELVPRIAPRHVFLIYAGRGAGGEECNRDYYRAAEAPKAIWKIPEAGHTGGYQARHTSTSGESSASSSARSSRSGGDMSERGGRTAPIESRGMDHLKLPPALDRRFEAVIFDWDGTAVPDRKRRREPCCASWSRRLRAGLDLGIVITGTHVGNVDDQLRARPGGPGRLYLCLNRGSEVFAADQGGLGLRPSARGDA